MRYGSQPSQKCSREHIKPNPTRDVSRLLAPHKHEQRDMPRCGALSLLQSRYIAWGIQRNSTPGLNSKFVRLTACLPACGVRSTPTPPHPRFRGPISPRELQNGLVSRNLVVGPFGGVADRAGATRAISKSMPRHVCP
jgi:hypothetical protein